MSSLKRITVPLSFLLQTSPAANSEEKRLFSQATSYTHQERSNFLFNNEILSDVKFVVPSSQHGECSDQKKKQDGDPSSQVFVGNQKSCIFLPCSVAKWLKPKKKSICQTVTMTVHICLNCCDSCTLIKFAAL